MAIPGAKPPYLAGSRRPEARAVILEKAIRTLAGSHRH
jgi:hypothetical protein